MGGENSCKFQGESRLSTNIHSYIFPLSNSLFEIHTSPVSREKQIYVLIKRLEFKEIKSGQGMSNVIKDNNERDMKLDHETDFLLII